VVVVAVIVVVVEVLVVSAASVIGGVVAGVPPTVVQAPNPRREAIRRTAERVSIWFQQYGTWSRVQDPSKPVFPNHRSR
jgi:hypothetical protein